MTQRLSFKQSQFIIHGLALAGFIFFIALGLWQINRAEEKAAIQANYLERMDQEPVRVRSQAMLNDLPLYTPIQLMADTQLDQSIMLDNQQYDKTVGVHVFSPITLANQSQKIILLNQGFLPYQPDRSLDKTQLDHMKAIEDQDYIYGIKWTWPRLGINLSPAQDTVSGYTRWSNLDAAAIAQSWNVTESAIIDNYTILLGSQHNNNLQRAYQPINPDFGPEKHYAYAIQWFSFALIIIILLIWNAKRIRKNRR